MFRNLTRRVTFKKNSIGNIRYFTEEYILGANSSELDRLKFQHEYVKPLMLRALDKVSIKQCNDTCTKELNILDVGFGAGLTTHELHNYFTLRTHTNVSIHAIDTNPAWHQFVKTNYSFLIDNNTYKLHNVDILNNDFDSIFLFQ
eukprot:308564_1